MNTGRKNIRCCSRRSPLRRWLIGRKLRQLELEDQQQEQLDQLIENAHSLGSACSAERGTVRRSIAALISKEGFDSEKAVSLVRRSADQQVERASALVTAFSAFYQGLEPRQRAQLQHMLRNRNQCRRRCCH